MSEDLARATSSSASREVIREAYKSSEAVQKHLEDGHEASARSEVNRMREKLYAFLYAAPTQDGPAEPKPTKIADICHKCKNGENVYRGDREWVHGANERVRCDASDLRDKHYGYTPGKAAKPGAQDIETIECVSCHKTWTEPPHSKYSSCPHCSGRRNAKEL